MSVFIPIPKKGNAKECSNYRTTAFLSHASKVMLKILQVRLKHYVNLNFQMFKLDLGTRDQIANVDWIIKKHNRVPEKISISVLLIMPKSLSVKVTANCAKILQEMGIPNHLTCLLRNLYWKSGSNSQNWMWNNRLVPNLERSMSRL